MGEYFTNFPEVTVDSGESITNVCLRIDFFEKIKDVAALFEDLQIRDGERPEDIALLAYNDPTLYWIILWVNNIANTYKDWPLSGDRLLDMISEKYGSSHIYDVHHHETISGSDLGIGIVVNSGAPFSQAITNFTYEDGLNEAKRNIKVLRPTYVPQVIAEYNKIFD